MNDCISIYTAQSQAKAWLQRYRGQLPLFACVLGFTETGLVPGISAAGATPHDRQYTAIADAEFLANGVQPNPHYPLPPLQVGASPVLISRAVVETLSIPVEIFNAGLPHEPAISTINLSGLPARCVSTGQAMPDATVQHLFNQGLIWGEKLAKQVPSGYLILGECVVGGTTTALAILTGLGFHAAGKVNSSHPICNHAQKWSLVQTGLKVLEKNLSTNQKTDATDEPLSNTSSSSVSSVSKSVADPFSLVAAVGDPMQITIAGMTIAASRICGVMLAGGTQMLAVYALTRALATAYSLPWQSEQVIVGTTRWVAEDPTGDTVGLANTIQSVPLVATQLSFAQSRYPQLQAYEQGYVKEGVGAGGCAIAAHLYQNWEHTKLLNAIEQLLDQY